MKLNYLVRAISVYFMLATIVVASAGSPQEEGREIIKTLIDRDNGFGDFRAEVTLLIRESGGAEYNRHMEVKSLEDGERGEKRLFVFDQPHDIKGTAVLSHTRDGADAQWIYLPAFKRVKRIAANNKASPFVSSEFSFEDMTSVELDKYTYRLIGVQTVDSRPCYVVEMVPTFDGSGYRRQVGYVDREDYVFRRVDYYDATDRLLKSLSLRDYARYLGQYWRARAMLMVNHQNQRETAMTWRQIAYRNGYNEVDFNVTALKRSR